jgi:hypothetical protein
LLERVLLAGGFAQEGHRLLARLVEGEDVGASEEREALASIDPVRFAKSLKNRVGRTLWGSGGILSGFYEPQSREFDSLRPRQ